MNYKLICTNNRVIHIKNTSTENSISGSYDNGDINGTFTDNTPISIGNYHSPDTITYNCIITDINDNIITSKNVMCIDFMNDHITDTTFHVCLYGLKQNQQRLWFPFEFIKEIVMHPINYDFRYTPKFQRELLKEWIHEHK